MENSRRNFFKNAGRGVLTLSLSSAFLSENLFATNKEEKIDKKKDLFDVGIAGYTFVKFKLEPSLEMTETVDVHFLSIKDFHLPLDSTSEQIAAFHEKLKSRGITGYAVGPIYMTSKAEVDKAFDYAKRVGVSLIVGVPEHDLLPYVNEKVKEYNFRYAIHNHGVKDKKYPSVESIYAKIKDLDTRMGICHDIGYSAEMGFDPAAVTLKYGHRIYEMHIKDMTEGSSSGKDCVIGRGVVDFPSLIKALRKTKYKGKCSIEMASADPLPVIAESVGYFKGVIKTL
ncbi:MAG TPA: TIM barrel protein [Chitinophagaceae bacterium]|jgi:sugar phosphate isomerase/epimerase